MAFTFIFIQKNGFMAKKIDQAKFRQMKVNAILADSETEFFKIAQSTSVDFYLIPIDDSLPWIKPFLKELKERPQTQDVPIIGQTFFQKKQISEEILSLLDEVLEEPIPANIWVEKIRSFLSQNIRQFDRIKNFLDKHPIEIKAVLKEPPSPPRRGPMSLSMVDLSYGGMLVKSKQAKALLLGEHIQFFFQPQFENMTLRGIAEVKRVSALPQSQGEVYGLQFTELDDSVKKWLKGFVFWEKEIEKNIEDMFYHL